MGNLQFTKEDKAALKEFTKNLSDFQRRYQEGNRKGQFIFNVRKVRGDKAIAMGYANNDKSKPIDPKLYYLIPISHVIETPYNFFMRALEKLNEPVTPEILSAIRRDYLEEYEIVTKQYADTLAEEDKRKLETNPNKE